jgi:hypothetical protein
LKLRGPAGYLLDFNAVFADSLVRLSNRSSLEGKTFLDFPERRKGFLTPRGMKCRPMIGPGERTPIEIKEI